MVILAVIFGAVFFFFSMGARGFQAGLARTGAIGDVQTFSRVFKRDVGLTHFYSISVANRTAVTTRGDVDRDGLCLAGLSDWRDSDRFETGTGLPKWDRWVMFYANREDLGRLYRMEMERARPGLTYYPLIPRNDLVPLMVGNPSALPDVVRTGTLCTGVHSLRFNLDAGNQMVIAELTTFTDAGLRMTSQERIEEYNESRLEIVPTNSYPPL